MSKKGKDLAALLGSLEDEAPVGPSPVEPGPAPVAPGDKIVPLNILVTPADRKRLRQLSLDTGLSLQKLGHEAWNALLEKRGLPPLEPVRANVPSGRSKR